MRCILSSRMCSSLAWTPLIIPAAGTLLTELIKRYLCLQVSRRAAREARPSRAPRPAKPSRLFATSMSTARCQGWRRTVSRAEGMWHPPAAPSLLLKLRLSRVGSRLPTRGTERTQTRACFACCVPPLK